MTLDEIFDEYSADDIDRSNLGEELLKITKLYNKYSRYFVIENRELRKLESRWKQLVQLKTEWYLGTLNGTDELAKLGWEPMRKMVLKTDVARVVESDREVLKLTEMVGEQRDKVQLLKDIAKEIKDRSWNIRGSMDWEKFLAGA